MSTLMPFDEYKKIADERKQMFERNGTMIECPCCKEGELFFNDSRRASKDIFCKCCEWKGELPN